MSKSLSCSERISIGLEVAQHQSHGIDLAHLSYQVTVPLEIVIILTGRKIGKANLGVSGFFWLENLRQFVNARIGHLDHPEMNLFLAAVTADLGLEAR